MCHSLILGPCSTVHDNMTSLPQILIGVMLDAHLGQNILSPDWLCIVYRDTHSDRAPEAQPRLRPSPLLLMFAHPVSSSFDCACVLGPFWVLVQGAAFLPRKIWGFFLKGNRDPESWGPPLASLKRNGTDGHFLSGLWRAVLWISFHGCGDCGCFFLQSVHYPESCLLHWTIPAVCTWSILCSPTLTSVGSDMEKLIFRWIQGINIKQLAEHKFFVKFHQFQK